MNAVIVTSQFGTVACKVEEAVRGVTRCCCETVVR